MTTEPDPGLECKLLKNTILTRTDLDDADLQQVVLDWITVRLEHSTTGFHLLGPDMENLCLDIQIKRDASVLLRSKHEFSQILSDREVAEAQRTHLFVTKKIEDENLTPEVKQEKQTKVDNWLKTKVDSLKAEPSKCQEQFASSEIDLRLSLQKLVDMIKAEGNESAPKTNLDEDAGFMDELTHLLNGSDVPMVETQDSMDSILKKRTLILGECGTPEHPPVDATMGVSTESSPNPDGLIAPTLVDPSSSQKVDLPPVLPENQLGDSAIFPPHSPSPLASEAEEKNVDEGRRRVLIVPPGHDVPIKQTMVNIFAPGSKETVAQKPQDVPTQEPKEPGSETSQAPGDVMHIGDTEGMRAASSEENAIKYISQLDDGPTKQALMSLCEASLNKVGVHFLGEIIDHVNLFRFHS